MFGAARPDAITLHVIGFIAGCSIGYIHINSYCCGYIFYVGPKLSHLCGCRWSNTKQSLGTLMITKLNRKVEISLPDLLYNSLVTRWRRSKWPPRFRCISTLHCRDVIINAMASEITSLTIVYSTVYSGLDQIKHESSASLALVRWPVNSPHKGTVTRKMFPFDDVIMQVSDKMTPFKMAAKISQNIAVFQHYITKTS